MSGLWVYARQDDSGAFITSTAVCAEHFYLSRSTPRSVGAPGLAQRTGDGPLSCFFCEGEK